MSHLLIVFSAALLLNVWFGYLRRSARKFSFKWFLYIHLSIPFIIPLRMWFGINPWWIPAIIFVAVLGQVIGARLIPRCIKQEA